MTVGLRWSKEFIAEVHPYDATDKQMLESMCQEKLDLKTPEVSMNCFHYIPGITIYDYSDVYEMDDLAEWYMGEGAA